MTERIGSPPKVQRSYRFPAWQSKKMFALFAVIVVFLLPATHFSPVGNSVIAAALQVSSVLALVVYIGWGVYTLDHRYRRHEEWPPAVEAATLLAILCFYGVQAAYLRHVMAEDLLFHLFALLGLFVSGAALYGHMAVSLTSRLIVDVVTPADEEISHQPRFGPAEALERQKDYAGAVQEYLVLARIFPRNHEIALRIAEAQVKLKDYGESIIWFERAFAESKAAEAALYVTNRIVEVQSGPLKNAAAGQAALARLAAKFPNSEEAAGAKARLGAVAEEPVRHAAALEALTDMAQGEALQQEAAEMPELAPKRQGFGLSAMDDVPLIEETAEVELPLEEPAPERRQAESFGLASMDTPLEQIEEEAAPRKRRVSLSLDAMEDAPPPQDK